MIRFFCPKCRHRLKVRDELARKHTKCPMCLSKLIVPERNQGKPENSVTSRFAWVREMVRQSYPVAEFAEPIE
jgi:uncharacterized protein YbaR (Trm112 family)